LVSRYLRFSGLDIREPSGGASVSDPVDSPFFFECLDDSCKQPVRCFRKILSQFPFFETATSGGP
jgi:hypothetical protein